MRKQGLRSPIVAAVVSHPAEPSVRWYVRTLAEEQNARIETVRLEDCADASALTATVRQIARAHSLGLLVVEWIRDARFVQAALDVGTELRIPTILLRDCLDRCRRIVVATDGGSNAIDLLWIAQKLAMALGVPVRVLRLRQSQSTSLGREAGASFGHAMEQVMSRMVGLSVEVEALDTSDPAVTLARENAPGDILLMGAPSPLRVSTGFAGTLPDLVVRRIPGTFLLYSNCMAVQPSFRRLLWGRLARPGLKAATKHEAISRLVEILVEHNQIPRSSRADFVDRAMQRERLMPTSVGSRAAFPHVRLRDFSGVAATFGVFPEGVDFGGGDGARSQFVCFLVSPHGFYEDYLSVLARFARRIVLPDIRAALLECGSSAQILDVLEPREGTVGMAGLLHLKEACS